MAYLLQVSASWFLFFSSFLLISTHAQQSWLDKATADRFRFPQCIENRTWLQLAAAYSSDTIISGGLGPRSSEAFGVWACFAHHPCLSVVSRGPNDMMCYAFNEENEHWYPWCLKSEHIYCTAEEDYNTLNTSSSRPKVSPVMAPIWSSTLQGEHDTGYIPTVGNMSHTIIMALRFPTQRNLIPAPNGDHSKIQCILSYGQKDYPSNHQWFWREAGAFDETSSMYQVGYMTWIMGEMYGNQVYSVNMDQTMRQIQGGKVMTLCAVVNADGQYILYFNGTSPESYNVWPHPHLPGTDYTSSTVSMDFKYSSSKIWLGTGFYADFLGVIHETRLYNHALSADEVQEVTDELCSLYS